MLKVVKKKKIGKAEGRRELKGGGQADEYEYEPIYEEIEAPKFVDFVPPDSYDPEDDRYWFCSRVGKTQGSSSVEFESMLHVVDSDLSA